jgi:hypothetical protein
MIPNKTGIWEWFNLDGVRRLVYVWNVFEKYPNQEPWFRVCWKGGYYDIKPQEEDAETTRLIGQTAQERFEEAGWSGGKWGKYMGQYSDFKEEELYL